MSNPTPYLKLSLAAPENTDASDLKNVTHDNIIKAREAANNWLDRNRALKVESVALVQSKDGLWSVNILYNTNESYEETCASKT